MKLRNLGTTGVRVSPLCLGAMMLGRWGNADRPTASASCTARSTPASTSSTRPTCTRPANRRTSSARRSPAEARRVVLATKVNAPVRRGRKSARQLAPLDHAADRGLPAAPEDRLDRPVPAAPAGSLVRLGESLGALTDLVRAGQGALDRDIHLPGHEIVEAHWAAERRVLERLRPASRRPTRCSCAASRPTCFRSCSATAWGRSSGARSAGGLAVRPLPQGARAAPHRSAARARSARFDISIPGNQAKLEAVEQLALLAEENGHDAAAAGDRLHDRASRRDLRDHRAAHDGAARLPPGSGGGAPGDDLDRLDEIVPPGANLNVADSGWENPGLAKWARRRAR